MRRPCPGVAEPPPGRRDFRGQPLRSYLDLLDLRGWVADHRSNRSAHRVRHDHISLLDTIGAAKHLALSGTITRHP
ncbi:hypothetical protein [Streptomyces sp. NPDC001068]|uniref:hypothetical protein n=1 Tax=Streptomyces sp. NPDC001068 TaxID=3364544 RepID=UPI00368111C1